MLEQYKLIMPKTVYAGLNSINNVGEIVEDVKKVTYLLTRMFTKRV